MSEIPGRRAKGQEASKDQVGYLFYGFFIALHHLPELYQLPQFLGRPASPLAGLQQHRGRGQFLHRGQLALHLVDAGHHMVEDVIQPLHGVEDGLSVSLPGHEHGLRGLEEVLVPREDLLELSHVDVLQDALEQKVQGLEVHHTALRDGNVDQLGECERETHSARVVGSDGVLGDPGDKWWLSVDSRAAQTNAQKPREAVSHSSQGENGLCLGQSSDESFWLLGYQRTWQWACFRGSGVGQSGHSVNS